MKKSSLSSFAFLLIIILFLMTIIVSYAYSNQNISNDVAKDFAYESIQKVIIFSLEKTIEGHPEEAVADPGGLILLLGEIDSDDSRNLLLQLTEISLGPAISEDLTYAIVKQGKAISQGLKDLLEEPVRCTFIKKKDNRKATLKCLSEDDRNRRIRRLLDLISKGKSLEYVL